MTDEIALLVGAPTREIEAMAISQGMFTLREDGVRLARRGDHDARRGPPGRGRRDQLSGSRAAATEYARAEWPSSSSTTRKDRRIPAAKRRIHVYELGDLDDFDWPLHEVVRAGVRTDAGAARACSTREPAVPVLLAIAEEPTHDDGGAAAGAPVTLPPALSTFTPRHRCSTPCSRAVRRRREPSRTSSSPSAATDLVARQCGVAVDLLGEADLDEVEAFYEAAYPGTWFVPRMLATGRYRRHPARRAARLRRGRARPLADMGCRGARQRGDAAGAARPGTRPRGVRGPLPPPARRRDRDDRAQRPGRQCGRARARTSGSGSRP